MSHLYGVGLDITTKRINLDFKLQLRKKGGIGIRSMRLLFRRFDENGNGKLDIEEFESALAQMGLFPKKVDLQALMKYYDLNQDGNITYEEFLNGLRDELTERRKAMVDKAWAIMDKDGSGQITASDIAGVFNVTQNQDYLDGKKTKEEILEDFLNSFDGTRGNSDGVVTRAEWTDYYSELSSSIASDEYFVKMMESVWCVPEEEDAAYKEKIELLTKTIRHKLQNFANKGQDEFLLRKLFKDFDLDGSGYLTVDELAAMLAKLELSVDRRMLFSLFNKFDMDASGTIEFEEFCRFIIFDPYK